MSHLTSMHHSFDISLASKYGVEEAILIHHFQHWIRINKNLKRNFKEGKTWTYQTRKEIQAHFPYWNFDKVKYLCEKLVDLKVLVTNNFNKSKIDKTLWYAFVDEKFFGLDDENSNNVYERQKCPSKGKSALREGKSAQPIPDTIPYTKTNSGGDIGNVGEKVEEKTPSPSSDKKKQEKISYGEYVLLKPGEYESLKEQYGQPCIDKYLLKLNNYIPNKPGHPYKDHAAVIRQWILKDQDEGKIIPIQPQKGESAERFERNKKICQFAESKLQMFFSSRVFFQAHPTEAILVSLDKDIEIHYTYDIDGDTLKNRLINDCNRFINYRSEEILTNKKGQTLGGVIGQSCGDLTQKMRANV